MVIVLFKLLQALPAAHRGIHTYLIHRKYSLRHLDVCDIVIHHQYLCQRSYKALPFMFGLYRQFQIIVVAQRFVICHLLYIVEGEYASYAVGTLYGYAAAHAFHKALAYRQSKACTFYGTVLDHIRALEAVEECRQALFFYTASGILNGYFYECQLVFPFFPVDVYTYVSALGILGCISQYVGIDLPYLRLITQEAGRQAFLHMHYKLHILIRKAQGYHVADIFDEQAQVIFRNRRLHLTGLYL